MASLHSNSKTNNILTEFDIPGAELPHVTPELCNIVQFKRWLACRGACVSEKADLIAR